MSERTSAGILLYRRAGVGGSGGPAGEEYPASDGARLEVLLAHPGGPHFVNRDDGDWTIPKGEPDDPDEPMRAVARREFAEETGRTIDAAAPAIDLGTIVQKGGKVVYAWAVEGDLEPAEAHSNLFEMEWPPKSGRRELFEEIDRVAWFAPEDARRKIKPTQAPFIDRLEEALL